MSTLKELKNLLAPKIYEEAKNELKKIPANKKSKAIKRIIEFYKKSCFEPGEAFGVISAQSLSEPSTQMSVDYSEKVILKHNGIIKISPIGEFVDLICNKSGERQKDGWEVCDISSKGLYVPSITANEKIEWKRVSEVSRHDSPETLLEIKTLSGRKIIATDSHSFVIRKNNKVVPVTGKELSAGNRIPAISFLPENCLQSLETEDLIGKPKFVKKPLPKVLRLDKKLGWIFGAYLSEGNSTEFYVSFSNTDPSFLSKIREFAKENGFTFNEYDNPRGFSLGHDIRINSKQLSKLMEKTCETGSKLKGVPDFAFSADKDFVSGLLRGYFDGDGNVNVERRMIRVSSRSKELIDGIALLLTRFGIFARKSAKREFNLSIPYKYAKKFRDEIGFIIKSKADRLNKLCLLFEKDKNSYRDHIDAIGGFDDILIKISRKLGLLTRYVNSFTKRQRIGRITLLRHIENFERVSEEKSIDIRNELNVLKRMCNADIVWDKIVSIKKVKPTEKYVYDFTVPGNETFTTFDGIVTHNTMRTYHIAGAVQIEVRQGLPRLIEVFDARKAPSTPSMNIYLKSAYNNKKKAEKLAKEITEVKLADISESVNIDLLNQSIEIIPDKKLMRESGIGVNGVADALAEGVKGIIVSVKGNKIMVNAKREVMIKDLKKIRSKILLAHVKGSKGIPHVIVTQKGKQWQIVTLGSNLSSVLDVKGVDSSRTYTNNIHEIQRVLGIEAARQSIINELMRTLEAQGLEVDIRPAMLVADVMTAYGTIKAIGRYGVAGSKGSVLARANFEETIKHLIAASINAERDDLDSIVENVMINQVVPVGTGMFDLVYKPVKKK